MKRCSAIFSIDDAATYRRSRNSYRSRSLEAAAVFTDRL